MKSTALTSWPPSPLLPPVSQRPPCRGYTYSPFPIHPPGVLVRAIGATSWMGLAVWMPWPSSPTHGLPLSPCYLLIPSLGPVPMTTNGTVASAVFIIFKKFHGASILIFFVKIGMKLLFTSKNKHRKTNLKFEFLKLLFWTPKKPCFGFWRKPPQTNLFFMFWLSFSFKNNRHTNVLMVALKKAISHQKRHFDCFWW